MKRIENIHEEWFTPEYVQKNGSVLVSQDHYNQFILKYKHTIFGKLPKTISKEIKEGDLILKLEGDIWKDHTGELVTNTIYSVEESDINEIDNGKGDFVDKDIIIVHPPKTEETSPNL
jgi:hypothetical protein